MDNTLVLPKKGQRLSNAQRLVAISKLAECLTESYYSTNELSKKTGLSRRTVDRYRPLVDDLIANQKIDRNVIRNLQVKRTYTIIEMLMKDLNKTKEDKLRQGYYNQIAKFSSHLALITGLNVETHVNVDQSQLVIIRADNSKKPIIDIENKQ